MAKYAGQRKRNRDIDKAIKRDESRKSSDQKKNATKKLYFYAKLRKKNSK